MRLAIADPPYLGRGAMLYGVNATAFPSGGMRATSGRPQTGDRHHRAAEWDDPAAHERLARRLVADYDRWAIAMNSENLRHYLRWVPDETRVAAWCRPDAFPAGRLVRSWEPVLVYAPNMGRGVIQRRDYLVATKASAGRLVGSKPPEWTRWVLDMLGYDPEQDTVDDMFGGSGAVSREIAQGVLDLG